MTRLQSAIDNVFAVVRPWLDGTKFNDSSRVAALNAALSAVAASAGERPSLAIATTDVGRLIDEVIKREGGYVDHPDDRGRATKFGITQATARANGFKGAMRDLSRDLAVSIYRQQYWIKPGFEAVAARYPRVAAELFDTGVNMGIGAAAKFLQRALAALTGATIVQDGAIGQQTLAALDAFVKARGRAGENVLVAALDCLQGERYISLVESRAQNRSFIFGWLSHRIGQA